MAEAEGLLNAGPLLCSPLRAMRRRQSVRAAYFDAAAPLFDSVTTRLQPTGFPRVTARAGPHAFDLQAIPDSLTFRKLPALWVMVSLPEALPVAATLDIMARPSGQEIFSHHASLPQSLARPDWLPPDTVSRSDDADHAPMPLVLPHAALFSDPAVKELLISAKGLRLVILAEEADRGRYLLFRDAELGGKPLPASRIRPLLDRLIALRTAIFAARAGE